MIIMNICVIHCLAVLMGLLPFTLLLAAVATVLSLFLVILLGNKWKMREKLDIIKQQQYNIIKEGLKP